MRAGEVAQSLPGNCGPPSTQLSSEATFRGRFVMTICYVEPLKLISTPPSMYSVSV